MVKLISLILIKLNFWVLNTTNVPPEKKWKLTAFSLLYSSTPQLILTAEDIWLNVSANTESLYWSPSYALCLFLCECASKPGMSPQRSHDLMIWVQPSNPDCQVLYHYLPICVWSNVYLFTTSILLDIKWKKIQSVGMKHQFKYVTQLGFFVEC